METVATKPALVGAIALAAILQANIAGAQTHTAVVTAPQTQAVTAAQPPAGATTGVKIAAEDLPPAGAAVHCTLAAGDVLVGTLRSVDAETLRLEHPLLGLLQLPLAAISTVAVETTTIAAQQSGSQGLAAVAAQAAAETPEASGSAQAQAAVPGAVTPADAAARAAAAGETKRAGADEAPVAAAVAPGSAAFAAGRSAADDAAHNWDSEASLGFDGSTGNSERSSFRLTGKTQRKSEDSVFKIDMSYTRAKDDGSLSESKLLSGAAHHWLWNGSPWELVASGNFELDELKDYDYRIDAFLGPGYRFIDSETTKLSGRVAAGASREFGGADDSITPELLFGADAEHVVSESQKLAAALEVYPDISDAGEFRSVATASWDIKPDVSKPWSLRLGIEDRFESRSAPGVESNDLDYFGSVVREF